MRMAVKGITAGLLAMLALGCGARVDPGTSDERGRLHARVEGALADFEATDPTLKSMMNSAEAYVIFPNVVSAAIVIGGAHGQGEAYEKGKLVGYADVSQGSVGAQLGGQGYAELILFETHSAFVDFTQSTLAFDARATAVAASSGAAAAADYRRVVVIFTLPQGGLMAQAAIGGQKFRYTAVAP
jgi:lipid-binding SYLF domain-containing protein